MTTETIPYRRLFLVLCVVWALLYFSVLFGGRVLPWDAMDQFYPTVYFNVHSLRAGLAPWWNPYIYAGYAQIGDPQGMLFSPLLMAWMLLRADPGANWFAWGVLLHLLMGGAAMLELLRRHGATALGALIGATVFMAGGVAASRLEHTPDVLAYAWVPVVLLALRHLLARPGLGRGCLSGLAAGALVTHLVQVSYLFVIVILGYACIATARHWPAYGTRQRRMLGAGIGVAAVVALLIGLPQLIFSWATLSLSNRGELPLALAESGSLDPRAFFFLFHPNAFGGLRDIRLPPIDIVQAFLYIGVLPLLALYTARRIWGDATSRRTLLCFGMLAILATIYMFGTNTPVYGWLYGWMPGLIHFRRPADAAYLVNFALSFIAAIATSRIDLHSRRELTGLLAAASVWLLVVAISMHDRHGNSYLGIVVALFALWRLRTPGSDWRAGLWLLAVLVADYRSFNLNGTFNASGNAAARFVRNPAALYLRDALVSGDAAPHDRIATLNTVTTWDNTGVLLGLGSTQGYNPLRYALYERWYGPRESSNAPAPEAPYNAAPESRLDDLLGVRYLVVGQRDGTPPFTPLSGYRKIQATGDVDIWRNDDAYPRFLNPTRVRAMAVDELPDIAGFAATDFATTLWLTPRDDDDLMSGRESALTCVGAVHTEVMPGTHTHTELRTHAASAGWVVAGELDYPGWEAELDGEPLAIHRANGMFRAVCVPGGEHRLRFVFRPWRLVAYAWQHRA